MGSFYYLHPTPTTNHNNMEFLIQGSRGEAVKTLKKILNEIGHQLEDNDFFCDKTTAAVTEFQKSASITADGTVGDITWAFLLNVQDLKARSRQTNNNG